ncbi:MAG: DinB family protein [Bryobacteraceae bacterium]
MQPEQAKLVADFLLHNIERESQTTRRVLQAVPADKTDYTPHEKNMTALQLAWHLASADVWFLNSIADARFDTSGEPSIPENIKSPADVVSWYDQAMPAAIERVRQLSAEALIQPIDFFGVANLPAFTYLNLSQVHTVHHRGQLSVYLRPMGAKVPPIYGPSGDVSFEEMKASMGA